MEGNPCRGRDLERARVREADAVLVLADPYASDTDAQDAATLMRVVAIKDYFPEARVVVQLLHYRSKSQLRIVPGWSAARGDCCVCVAELKLGLIAQNALAPGFCTLLEFIVG